MRDNYLLSVKKSIVDFVLRDPRGNIHAKVVEIPPHRKVNDGCHGDHCSRNRVFSHSTIQKSFIFMCFLPFNHGSRGKTHTVLTV